MEAWPKLPLQEWKNTYATLHMWTQIVGKVQLALTPRVNHWWSSGFFVSPRGFLTGPIPHSDKTFQVEFDFIDHTLRISTSDGARRNMALAPRTVADFYQEFMSLLRSIDLETRIDLEPKEVPNPIRFDQDCTHRDYNPEYANRLSRIFSQCDRLLRQFRSGFIGKCSPVEFFWGTFDLTVTRFSGRRAPDRPNADSITREAYSHEVSSCGFWPGSGNIEGAAFYSYAAPEPRGFSSARVKPSSAFYNAPTKNFILMYDDVRSASDPEQLILDFCQSTYDACADLGKWDRASLERAPKLALKKAV